MMKCKAILCDDDQIILSGLKKLIPWSDLGIELCGCAYNGKDAKVLFETYMPDILVSDIKMPFFDGLQLAEYARELNPDIKVIIISGYDDFNYAQAAIRAGAMDYILKPIDEIKLINQLRKAVDECRKKEMLKMMEKEHKTYLEEKMIQCLIFEGDKAFLKKYEINELNINLPPFCSVMMMELDSYAFNPSKLLDNELQDINNMFNSCLQQIISMNIGIFEQRPGIAGLYIFGDSLEQIESMRSEAIFKFQDAFRQLCAKHSVIFACGNIYNSVMKLRQAYNEAQIAMKEHFVNPSATILYYHNFTHNNAASKDLKTILTEMDFVSLIKQGDKGEIEAQLKKLKGTLLEIGGKSNVFMKVMAANLYARLFKEIKQLGLEQEGFKLDPLEEYQKTAECNNVEEVIFELRKSMFNIMDFLEKSRGGRNSKLIAKALDFIETHYMQHEFSIEDVAKYVHMSPNYFSVIFKAEQGTSFTDYLIKIRIENSIILMLSTDMPIYEISYKVGYDTAAYFSSAFKKYTGYSPSIYKKNLKSSEPF